MDKKLISQLASKMLDVLIAQSHGHKIKLLSEESILDALKACNYNKVDAAKMLKCSRSTLYRNMDRLGL